MNNNSILKNYSNLFLKNGNFSANIKYILRTKNSKL